VAVSLNDLGTVAQDQHDDHRALAFFPRGVRVAKGTADRNRIALVLTNLGKVLNRVGEAEKAIYYLKQAEELAERIGDKIAWRRRARSGRAYLARREYTKARECMLRAVEIFTEIQKERGGHCPARAGRGERRRERWRRVADETRAPIWTSRSRFSRRSATTWSSHEAAERMRPASLRRDLSRRSSRGRASRRLRAPRGGHLRQAEHPRLRLDADAFFRNALALVVEVSVIIEDVLV